MEPYNWYECPECLHAEQAGPNGEMPDDCPACGFEALEWQWVSDSEGEN
jgi:hypothetical protein